MALYFWDMSELLLILNHIVPTKKENIDFDDIVFENRNKDYGAYPIRKGYKRRFWWSLTIAIIVIVSLTFLFNNYGNEFLPPPPKPLKTIDVHINDYKVPKLKQPVPDKKETSKKKEEIKSKATKNLGNPNVSKNTQEKDGSLVINPVNGSANIASVEVEGPELDVKPFLKPEEHKETLPITKETIATKDEASIKVNMLPHYVGGDSAWYQFLRANINVNTILRNGAMPSVYTAVVAFVVHPDSTLSDFKIVKDPGFGTGAEALRIVQKSGKWVPGKKNNKPVKFAQLQTVVFRIKN